MRIMTRLASLACVVTLLLAVFGFAFGSPERAVLYAGLALLAVMVWALTIRPNVR